MPVLFKKPVMKIENSAIRWVVSLTISFIIGVTVYFINYDPAGGCDGGLCLFGVLGAFGYGLLYFTGFLILLVNILKR